jgi:hypothetical protein
MRRATIRFQKAVRSCASPIADEALRHGIIVNVKLDIIVIALMSIYPVITRRA